jgi:predicted lipase
MNGLAKGFILTDTLYDGSTDLTGFVGVIHNMNTIYVVIRGTSSMLNWMDDLECNKVPYLTYPECDCKVHYGFYNSILRIREHAIASVMNLLDIYPNYNVILTGHSYGAATILLLSLELLTVNIQSSVYNFGQPRCGDANFLGMLTRKSRIIGDLLMIKILFLIFQ